ncbi:MAG: hypothetical protein RJB39_174 [Candidatus Parcubacteria bacterium]|jgi:glutamyl-tRNA synthetase
MIVTRFPPSPTGHAHIGSYRTAIFNYLFSKQNKGKFLLRIEDTDKARSKQEYQDGIIESIKWLGLEYDGFSIQTENMPAHKAAMQKLVDEGKAYISKEEAKDGSGAIKEIVRFKNPNKPVTFKDLILGEVTDNTTDLGDFVIGRNIEDPLYHLAVVVDDMNSEVTHVIRGVDHISNTTRQILLIEALGGRVPTYAHIPMVLGDDKQKLSKRKGALSVLEYKKRGYLPAAILNAATFMGFNPGGEKEIYTLDELIEVFDITKVQKGGAVFNQVKLDWFNTEHMKLLSEAEYLNQAKAFIPEEIKSKILDTVVDKILLANRDRISYFGQLTDVFADTYMYETPAVDTSLLIVPEKMRKEKMVTIESTKIILTDLLGLLERAGDADFTSIETVKNIVWEYAETQGRGIVLWPLRIALTGKEKSIDPFSMMWILNRDEVVKRLKNAIATLV